MYLKLPLSLKMLIQYYPKDVKGGYAWILGSVAALDTLGKEDTADLRTMDVPRARLEGDGQSRLPTPALKTWAWKQ